jgi:hypothetical protein
MVPFPPGLTRRSIVRIAAAVAALIAMATACACFEAMLSPSQYSTIRVMTSDPDGVPVGDVRLTLYTGQRPMEYAATDGAGEHLFERVPPGNYGVLAQFPDEFRDQLESPYLARDNLVVEKGSALLVPMTQARCVGSVLLTVRDVTGRPGTGIPATLYDADGDVGTKTTSSDGTARFDDLHCRQYGVKLGAATTCTIASGRGSSFVDSIPVTRRAPSAAVTLTAQSCGASG